jgi:hypothetical protein
MLWHFDPFDRRRAHARDLLQRQPQRRVDGHRAAAADGRAAAAAGAVAAAAVGAAGVAARVVIQQLREAWAGEGAGGSARRRVA